MPTEPPSQTRPRARLVLAVVALGGVLVLGWQALSLGLADHYAATDPGRALAWHSQHPEALLRRAEQLASDPAQAAAAEAHARRALVANPLDGRAYRVLGQLADAAGDIDRAAGLYGLAADRSPQDLRARAWLLDHALASQDAAGAVDHLDALLRLNPNLLPRMLPVLNGLASTPPALEPLLARLARQPPWRTGMLVQLAQHAEDAGAVAPLFERLRSASGGLAPPELAAWLDRLAKDGQWGPAYLIWASQLDGERQRSLGNVFNGGFEWEPGQGGFDWRFGRIAGARIARLGGEGVTGRVALRVAFEDQRVRFKHVRQLLALAPGRYRLQGRARPDKLRSERGLVWSVACADGEAPVLAETLPLRGNGPWREFEVAFEVPEQGCGGQWLALVLPARIPAEQRIVGRAWFDDMKIIRVREAEPGATK
jgi:tetratricopeptide (TPR) repeat protein